MSVSIEGLDGAAVTLAAGQGRADSSLKRLTGGGQPFFLLKQRGRFPDIAYDHARLLAPEVENGAFPEIIATIARGVNLESATLSKVAGALYRCYSDRVLRHCSPEFRAAVEAFAVGYRDGIGQPGFSDLQVRDARSEEHTSELQSLMRISYAVFCLKKTNKQKRSYDRAT